MLPVLVLRIVMTVMMIIMTTITMMLMPRRCPRFPEDPGWGGNFAAKALARVVKLHPPVTDYTEGALDSLVGAK